MKRLLNDDYNKSKHRYSLSLKQRLPLLICALLLLTVVSLGGLSYLGVRNASMTIGKERLSSLTTQLSGIFGQAAVTINAATRAAVQQPVIKNFMRSGSPKDSAQQLLDKLRIDSTWPQVDLLNMQRQLLLRSAEKTGFIRISADSVLSGLQKETDSSWVGKIYQSGDSIIYPIVTTIMDNRKISGFLIRWRLQTSTTQATRQLSQLLGTNAQLYFGNRDGSLWTNLVEIKEAPPIGTNPGHGFVEYTRPGGDPVMASESLVPGTQWIILVEFSKAVILQGAHDFLKWVISIGTFIILAGCFIAWLISRRITAPLEKLSAAATEITAGNFGATVPVQRNDELGYLTHSFNRMSEELNVLKKGLEEKVKQRTMELEVVNKELEAFSYSVSHDLRAPLRSINGYANILYEDYATKLDEEAIRITGKIMSNGKKMGELIDDLISFSQVARKEIKNNIVNMQALVKSCEEELLAQHANENLSFITDPLPACKGDEGLLRQVWINLIGNAIKYSSKKPKPLIEVGSLAENNETIYFVRDNGAGFDMRYADKLFGVFQRLHTNKEFDGTGIGLALAKRIINRHNGRIYAEAKPGEGACFYFTLST